MSAHSFLQWQRRVKGRLAAALLYFSGEQIRHTHAATLTSLMKHGWKGFLVTHTFNQQALQQQQVFTRCQ